MLLDIEVARNAGVAVYAVPTGSATRETLVAGRPDRVVPKFSDLLTYLPAL
jgi:phosphoglycolate phosphatase-like HAD superfamily hydrolase